MRRPSASTARPSTRAAAAPRRPPGPGWPPPGHPGPGTRVAHEHEPTDGRVVALVAWRNGEQHHVVGRDGRNVERARIGRVFGPEATMVSMPVPSAPARRMAASISAATARSVTPGRMASPGLDAQGPRCDRPRRMTATSAADFTARRSQTAFSTSSHSTPGSAASKARSRSAPTRPRPARPTRSSSPDRGRCRPGSRSDPR